MSWGLVIDIIGIAIAWLCIGFVAAVAIGRIIRNGSALHEASDALTHLFDGGL